MEREESTRFEAVKPHYVIAALLVAVSAAIAACAIHAGLSEPRSQFGSDAMLAVGLAQVALLAAWTAWGRRFTMLRTATLVGGVAAWSVPLAQWNPENETVAREWIFALASFSGVIVIALAAIRAAGWSIHIKGTEEASASRRRRAGQFSLWDLLSLLTSAGLVAGLFTWLQVPWQSLFDMATLFGLLAAPVIVCLIAGIACRRVSRLLLWLIPALIAGAILRELSPSERDYAPLLAMMCGYVMLAMQALRSFGLRLAKRLPTLKADNPEINSEPRSSHPVG